MDVNSLVATTSRIYFDIGFMSFLDQHLEYIKTQGLTVVSVTDSNAYKHTGNFYGMLAEINIPYNYHYVVMRINGLMNSSSYDGRNTVIQLPDTGVIEQLKNQYLTKKN